MNHLPLEQIIYFGTFVLYQQNTKTEYSCSIKLPMAKIMFHFSQINLDLQSNLLQLIVKSFH